ncbi:MAG TPA: sigma 54-interacting transcriptional regulator [Haliangium sp.]|nr:sigma 54-interacting transcriptional regulator [Haliangium sp.]
MPQTHTVQDTLLEQQGERPADDRPVPGLVLVFTGTRPVCGVMPFEGERLVIGRDQLPERLPPDARMSRTHAEVRWDGQRFLVRDLGSRNGTFADGKPVPSGGEQEAVRTLRTGTSVFLLSKDVRPFQNYRVSRIDELVLGPSLAAVWRQIDGFARADSNLFLRGESGAGKEQAVQAFHAHGPRSKRSLVAVNCGAIPEGMAERLVFGTKRGAYSGATADAPGYVQAADGGILFLDEVAELDLAIQAKLLRVLETKEVLALGDTRPQRVDFQLCVATHKDLHAEVSQGRFRQDLYFRIARPEVRLPPLRERLEEIPWLIELALEQALRKVTEGRPTTRSDVDEGSDSGSAPLSIRTAFVDACMQRSWPGNVRELLVEVRSAVHMALSEGSKGLEESHLAPQAGMGFVDESQPGSAREAPDRDALESVLIEHKGNISAAARALGVHRTQLRRWLSRHGLEAAQYSSRDDK